MNSGTTAHNDVAVLGGGNSFYTAEWFSGELDPRARELVICAVATHWRSDYDWYAHSERARSIGVPAAELASFRNARIPESAAPSEVAALRLARAGDDEDGAL
jgi:alkylhydroperoxidase family enzyme